jgi:hypothetical protein
MLNRIHLCQLIVLILARLATGLCRQAQTPDDKAGGCRLPRVPSIPFLPHTSSRHVARHGQPRRAFFVPFLDSTYPSPSTSPLSAEDDDGKLDSHVKRECDLKGHIPYQRDVKPNEHSSSRMAIFSCGTTNAHGRYVNGSNSRYVASFFSSVVSAASYR